MSNEDANRFRKDCRDFVVRVLTKLKEITPLKNRVAQRLTFLDPSIATQQLGVRRLHIFMEELIRIEWISGRTANMIKDSFMQLMRSPTFIQEAKSFRKEKMRLHEFWMRAFKAEDSIPVELVDLVIRICILSHGQASDRAWFQRQQEPHC